LTSPPAPPRHGEGRADRGQDALQYGVYFVTDVIIGHAQDGQTATFQRLVSLFIALTLRSMYWPVDFDHDASRVAVEINDEAIDDLLPAEVQASELVGAQPLP